LAGADHAVTTRRGRGGADRDTDLLSNGAEFGPARVSITELEPFGRSMEEKRAIWEDGLRAVIPMFKEGGCEYDGPYFKMPYRNVLPKPIQRPHPPLWVACSQLETIEMAGRRGLGALAFQFLSAEAAHAWVHAYYNAFVKRMDRLADYQPNANIALVSYFMCAETDEEAAAAGRWRDVLPVRAALLRAVHGRRRPRAGTVNMWEEFETWRRENPENVRRSMQGALIGSPETLRRQLQKFQSSNIDQVILLFQAGKNSHQHICESLELFAREVMPEFHADEPAHQEWKRKVLAREIELEEIDTTPYRERFGPNTVPVPVRPAAE
jgi:alkanesulfonate monooxygenase SsuD/methylene tetrahydromethanopterin reductase-like flavin-dependent oxidoreductase (luciferase family)